MQTLVVLLGGGQPNPVVRDRVTLFAEYEDDLVPDVHRETAEHGPSSRRELGEGVKHELVRNDLAGLELELGAVRQRAIRSFACSLTFQPDGSAAILAAR